MHEKRRSGVFWLTLTPVSCNQECGVRVCHLKETPTRVLSVPSGLLCNLHCVSLSTDFMALYKCCYYYYY